MTKITSAKHYNAVMTTIESLLDKATRLGGFHMLSKNETDMLARLSKDAETYEDDKQQLMPIKPKTIQEAVEYKRVERGMTQEKLAKALGIGAPKFSQIMTGKREPDVAFLSALYNKLKIDADFLLSHVSAKKSKMILTKGTGLYKGTLVRQSRSHVNEEKPVYKKRSKK